MREFLKNGAGLVIGYIEEHGGITQLFDSAGKLLGQHSKSTDWVTDAAGRVIGKGIKMIGLLLNK